MKKALALVLAILIVYSFSGCSDKEDVHYIEFPFEVGDVQSIEVYHRSSELTSCEVISVTDAGNIKKIYKEFTKLPLEDYKETESAASADAVSIRINLADGTEFDIVFFAQENGGYLSYTSGAEQYYTSENVSSSWSKLAAEYTAETIGIDEMP